MLLTLWLIWIVTCIGRVLAGGVSGSLEKMFLQGCYEIAWAWKGKDQNYILKQGKSSGAANSHWGSGPEGMLTFQEFMDDITNQPRGTCTVTEPASSETMPYFHE